MDELIQGIPKAELHIHIEGLLEPELIFELAAKNGIPLQFESVADIHRAYDFKELHSFLDIYYQGTKVLLTEDDFYQMICLIFKKQPSRMSAIQKYFLILRLTLREVSNSYIFIKLV